MHPVYKLILPLPDDAAATIIVLRQSVIEHARIPAPAAYRPQLILSKFLWQEAREPALVAAVQQAIEGTGPLPLVAKGFGHFGTHSLHLSIAPSPALLMLVAAIRRSLPRLRAHAPSPIQLKAPAHLSLLRRLKPADFTRAWHQFERSDFEKSFTITELWIVKKPEAAARYTVCARIPLFPGTAPRGQMHLF